MADILTMDSIAHTLHGKFDADDGIDICLVYGSYAMGRANINSDVDIAVHSPNGAIDIDALVEMQLSLSDMLRREVDLADIARAEGLFLYEIMTHGVRIKIDSPVYMHYYMEALYFYEDFLPIQKRINEGIIRRFIDGN